MKKTLLFLAVSLFAIQVAAGYSEGETAFNEQRYTQAFTEFLPLAENGDFRSEYYVGYLYLNGYGVPRDTKRALEYLNKAINQNYDMAQSLMAFLYSQGDVVPKDKKKALALYEKAAGQGNASALLNLGVSYYTGDGVERDAKKALEYFGKVSTSEQPIVARYLGDIYLNNKELADPTKAFNYYLVAAKSDDLGAYHALGYMYQNGISTAISLPDAMKFYTYAAAQNHAPSQYALGVIYANGDGVPRDKFKAYAWLSLAAEQQLKEAQKAKDTLSENMSLSERDKANRAMIDIQQNEMKTTVSPLKDVIVQKQSAAVETPRGTVRRRRR